MRTQDQPGWRGWGIIVSITMLENNPNKHYNRQRIITTIPEPNTKHDKTWLAFMVNLKYEQHGNSLVICSRGVSRFTEFVSISFLSFLTMVSPLIRTFWKAGVHQIVLIQSAADSLWLLRWLCIGWQRSSAFPQLHSKALLFTTPW